MHTIPLIQSNYIYFACMSVCLFVCYRKNVQMAERIRPKFCVDLTRSQGRFMDAQNYKNVYPFLLRTSLTLSYLLHSSMSQELFGMASKHRNKKQEENKIEQEKWKETLR